MAEITISANLMHVEPYSSNYDVWRSETTITDRVATFPVDIRAPEKPPPRTMYQQIRCPQCGEAYRVIIRAGHAIVLFWILNIMLWTLWAIPLLFVLGKLLLAFPGDPAGTLVATVAFGFLYLLIPTQVALALSGGTERLNFSRSRGVGHPGHYLFPR